MNQPSPRPQDADLARLLGQLSHELDEARQPLMRMDVARVEALALRHQTLLRDIEERIAARGGVPDPETLRDVRHKLIRNRVLAAHVLQLTGQLQAQLAPGDAEGYGADGAARSGSGAGRLVRTSV
jgi:hypothetical protein